MAITDGLKAFAEGVLNSSAEDSFTAGKGLAETITGYMTFNDQEGVIIETVMETLEPIAFTIIIIYFMSGLIEQYLMAGRELDAAAIAKTGAGLVIADFLLQISYFLVGKILTLQNGFLKVFSGIIEKAGENQVTSNPLDLSGESLVTLILLVTLSALGGIVRTIASLIIAITVFSAKLEILVRCAFLPIGISGIVSDSHRQSAMRYLRKTVAAMLYGGMVILVMYVASQLPLAEAITEDYNGLGWIWIWLKSSIMSLIAPFAGVGAISVGKSIINEALEA